jgi:hypothetical protein
MLSSSHIRNLLSKSPFHSSYVLVTEVFSSQEVIEQKKKKKVNAPVSSMLMHM